MTREDTIEKIREEVLNEQVTNVEQLNKVIEESGHDLDWSDDILSGMDWNCCDRCGALEDCQLGLYWVDCADDEYDSELLKGMEKEGRDYCAICYDCVDELKKIAEK